MSIIFELNHPKHYHQFKHLIVGLSANYKVIIIAREKEILFNLLDENNIDYIRFSHSKSGSLFKKIAYHLFMLSKLLWILSKEKPAFFLSKASVSTIFVKVFLPSCKTIIFPDSEIVWLTNKIIRRFANLIFTPEFFSKDFGKKHIRVPGIFENSYLSPIVNPIIPIDLSLYGYNPEKKSVFIRFVGWAANHDLKHHGFSYEQKTKLIALFAKHSFNIIISSEKGLPIEFEQYRNQIPASKVHNLLVSCQFYVGDSQTMASEAAILGLKSFRFNSFVGEDDMSNFKYLERKGLLLNFSDFSLLLTSLKNELIGASSFFQDSSTYWDECGEQNQFIYNYLINT